MKSLILLLGATLVADAMEYQLLVDNDKVRISRICLLPHESVGLHRDALPRVIVGVKEGVFTRIEADGSRREIHFPAGKAIFLDADPLDELHCGVNGTTELEIVVTELKH